MGRTKQTALQAFVLNTADAELMADLAGALTNQRSSRMRREKREAIGDALRVRKTDWDALDCVESDDFFVVLKAGTDLDRTRLKDVRPLLRQSLVAGCAAIETYVADRVMELLGPVLRTKEKPSRLLEIGMTVEHWFNIEERYKRKGWGIREIVGEAVREKSSPAPSQIGACFAIVGEKQILKRADAHLGRTNGTGVASLDRIYERRNRIAHAGDRVGQGRADIKRAEVVDDLGELRRVAEALDAVTPGSP